MERKEVTALPQILIMKRSIYLLLSHAAAQSVMPLDTSVHLEWWADWYAQDNHRRLLDMTSFFQNLDEVIANEMAASFPSCVEAAQSYQMTYLSTCLLKNCASEGSEGVSDVCCNGLEPWANLDDGCENYMNTRCCSTCVDESDPAYPYRCSTEGDDYLGSFFCNESPLKTDVYPLYTGTQCEVDEPISFSGFYDVDKQAPSCEFLTNVLDDEVPAGEFWNGADTNAEFQAMKASQSFAWRSTVTGGSMTYENTARCLVMMSPTINGILQVNPSNNQENDVEAILYNPSVIPGSDPAVLKSARYALLGGYNGGEILIDSDKEVKIGFTFNAGDIVIENSKDVAVVGVRNEGEISFLDIEGLIYDMGLSENGKIIADKGMLRAAKIQNNGTIHIKPDTYCILELLDNRGTVTIDEGAYCKVYLHHEFDQGILSFPTSGVEVVHGSYDPPMALPKVEFGGLTSGSYRAGSKRFVGDKAFRHAHCNYFRYNTLGIQSVIQSPSDEGLNILLEISHQVRQIKKELAFINVTLIDQYDQKHEFFMEMFGGENPHKIVFNAPPVELDGTIRGSDTTFKILLNLDFEAEEIVKSMENTIDVTIYSFRETQRGLRLDAEDCVRMVGVGVPDMIYL